MGNICGKESADPMAQPGRRVGSAPASGPKTVSVPKTVKVGGPARTLGGASPTADEPGDAGRRAAEAAEVRSKTSRPPGKLQRQLDAQKKQTMSETLQEAGKQERRRREVEGNLADPRNWN